MSIPLVPAIIGGIVAVAVVGYGVKSLLTKKEETEQSNFGSGATPAFPGMGGRRSRRGSRRSSKRSRRIK
jgi:hypothetical protein